MCKPTNEYTRTWKIDGIKMHSTLAHVKFLTHIDVYVVFIIERKNITVLLKLKLKLFLDLIT